jgi:transcriptional regulator with XRE-family HTH domain
MTRPRPTWFAFLRNAGPSVRAWRKRTHITAHQLAARAGLHVNTLYLLERGETVSSATLGDILDAVGVIPPELIMDEGTAEIERLRGLLRAEQRKSNKLRTENNRLKARKRTGGHP